MMKQERRTLAKKITLGLVIGAVMASGSLAYAQRDPDKTVTVDYDWIDYVEIWAAESTNKALSGYTLNVIDGEGGGYVYGVVVDAGNATDNQVNITGGTFNVGGQFDMKVYGALVTYAGHANQNQVTIGSPQDNVIGSESVFTTIYGGYTKGGEANENKVFIYGGKYTGLIAGGYSPTKSNANTVTLAGGTFSVGTVYGGLGNARSASNNQVTIGSLTDNKITTEDTFQNVYGGKTHSDDAAGNSVTIYGGTFTGTIAGGSIDKTRVKANNNTVTIAGGDVSKAMIFGGKLDNDGVYGGKDNPNTLNFGTSTKGYTGAVKSIAGFDVIHFNSVDWQKDSTVISANSLALNPNDGGTTITVGSINIVQGGMLNQDDSMTLISSDKVISGKLDASNSSVTANVNEGIARTYSNTDFVIETSDDNSKINLRFGDNIGGDNIQLRPTRNDQVLVLGESRAAAMAFTNQGAELVELSMDALHRREAEEDMQVFASAYGNASEYETGSHVKVNGYSSIVGIGKKNDSGLSYGAFFENGTGNYSTHNVTDGEYMRGDGEATYNGGGIFVRKDNPNGVYVEGAFRAGNLSNKLERAVRNGDHLTGYDINTLYYGAQLGVGKIIPVGKNSLDVYGKFLYTHHDSERFDIEGTDMYFDSVTSQRLRLGARMNHEQNAKLNLYYGAAWEYEFDGDAQDKVDEFDLDTPSLEGSTVIGELGLNYRANDKWTVDLNFRGYGGQRDGYSGSVHVNCAF